MRPFSAVWSIRVVGLAGLVSGSLKLSSPLSLVRVIKFAALFNSDGLRRILGQRYFGNTGFLAFSLLGGLLSSASTTAAAAALTVNGSVSPQIAAAGTVMRRSRVRW
jgi:uncharacterized membrane protein (DUF4010 family)